MRNENQRNEENLNERLERITDQYEFFNEFPSAKKELSENLRNIREYSDPEKIDEILETIEEYDDGLAITYHMSILDRVSDNPEKLERELEFMDRPEIRDIESRSKCTALHNYLKKVDEEHPEKYEKTLEFLGRSRYAEDAIRQDNAISCLGQILRENPDRYEEMFEVLDDADERILTEPMFHAEEAIDEYRSN